MKWSYNLQNILGKLYQYQSVKIIKEWLRPVKHFLFGKTRIYRAIEDLLNYNQEILTVFDVGAAVGDTAITFLKSFPQAQVYCFEPLKKSFNILSRRTKKYTYRARLFNFGFFNESSEKNFNVSPHADGSSLLKPQGNLSKSWTEKATFKKIDDFVKKENIDKIDLLKIDVEGVEKEVLEGARETLSRVQNVFIEISFNRKGKTNSDYIKVFQILNETGFYLVNNYEHENFYFKKLNLKQNE